MVLPVSDYTQIAKEYMLPNQKKSLWEQFLTGTQTAFQQQAQQVQDVYSYDISQAYANYKKQQLQLQMNERLGAGFQQQVGEQLQTEYGTAYQDIKTKETSALADVQEAYEEAYEEGESRFSQFGQTGQSLDKAIFEFAKTQGYDFADTTKLYKSRRDGGYELFKKTEDAAGNVTTELTEYGKDFYNKMLHGTENRFVEFLQESDDYEGLYDLYMANPDLYNYMVGGLEYGTRKYDETRMTNLLAQEVDQTFKNLESTNADLTALQKAYGENINTLTAEQSYDLERNIKRTSDYIGTISNTTGGLHKKVTDSYGKTWEMVDYNREYKESNAPGTKKDKTALQIGKELGVINSKGKIVKSHNYQDNDVIYHNGKYYVLNISYKGGLFHDKYFSVREVVPGDVENYRVL